MDPLEQELAGRGLVDDEALAWARDRAAAAGVPLDSALLALELVDEASLLAALGAVSGLPAARPADLAGADPAVAARLGPDVAASFHLCPLRAEAGALVVLVTAPLPRRWRQELSELFGVTPDERVAPAHYLGVARAAVYGVALDPGAAALEARLGPRRGAPTAAEVAARLAAAASLEEAAGLLLDHAARFLDHVMLCRRDERGLNPWLGRGAAVPRALPLEPGCAFAAAARYGGYYLGPLGDTPAHRRLYEALGRAPPAAAFLAPVPGTALCFYGDNGPRGLAARPIAELTVLLARLGQPRPPRAAPRALGPEAPAASPPGDEAALLARLRGAARAAGVTPAALLDELLAPRPAPTAPALDVAGLLERLAADIPAQLARGLESAVRDVFARVPLAAGAPPPAAPPPRPAAADLVLTAAAPPREVADYRSRRRKLDAVKL
jgi:hypothetical protein